MKKHKRPNESNDFRCKHCRAMVSGQAIGTKQRNHCPICLYSLHVDEKVGDRKSSCRRPMMPIGLTMKKDGEIMIVSKCISCGKISANRIAGDDKESAILELLNFDVDVETEIQLRKANIPLIHDKEEVETQLFGKKTN